MKIPDILLLTPPNRVWRTYPGGKTLDELSGSAEPSDSHFAEEWIASTTRAVNKGREDFQQEGLSKVEINGELYYLKMLMEEFPEAILGRRHYEKYGANTQFLLKFLDSAIRLHIQAHPTIPFAQKYLNSNSGKTEAYVILGSRSEVAEPYIYLGFQHPLSKEAFRRAVLEQDQERLLSCFEKIPVKAGDVFIVPGGLPHAIGEGVFMIEIMEPTDFVVRLEFERGGYVLPEEARFMGRDVDFALDMIDFSSRPVEQIREKFFCRPAVITKEAGFEESILISSEHTSCFSVHQLNVSGNYNRRSEGFHVGIVSNGEGVAEAGSEKINLKKGDKFLIPFQTEAVKYSGDWLEIVFTYPPKG
ncbi:phosphomannose isomerase-like protein [Flammeovirgaceae bacterium 311]|nr:phosphomannose isomerase-like protein [Flammeovirgaceae bacterium 311]